MTSINKSTTNMDDKLPLKKKILEDWEEHSGEEDTPILRPHYHKACRKCNKVFWDSHITHLCPRCRHIAYEEGTLESYLKSEGLQPSQIDFEDLDSKGETQIQDYGPSQFKDIDLDSRDNSQQEADDYQRELDVSTGSEALDTRRKGYEYTPDIGINPDFVPSEKSEWDPNDEEMNILTRLGRLKIQEAETNADTRKRVDSLNDERNNPIDLSEEDDFSSENTY